MSVTPTSDPHIVYGETDAFPEQVLKWFNENDSMGYLMYPSTTGRYEAFVT